MNQNKNFIYLTSDEMQLLPSVPDEICRFFREQIDKIKLSSIYPKAFIFEYIQKGTITQLDVSLDEKKAAILLQLKISESDIVWACPDCERIIGTIDKPPLSFKERYSINNQSILSGLFLLYANQEKLKCPFCESISRFLFKPTFLISGLSIQSQFNKTH